MPDDMNPTLTDLRIIRAACYDQMRRLHEQGFAAQSSILGKSTDKLDVYIKQLEAENAEADSSNR